jgi:hypothetical protein
MNPTESCDFDALYFITVHGWILGIHDDDNHGPVQQTLY